MLSKVFNWIGVAWFVGRYVRLLLGSLRCFVLGGSFLASGFNCVCVCVRACVCVRGLVHLVFLQERKNFITNDIYLTIRRYHSVVPE